MELYSQMSSIKLHGGRCMIVPRLFAFCVCKQVMGVAGTNEMEAQYTPNHNKNKCPSCWVPIETCGHVLNCEEDGRSVGRKVDEG